MNPLSIVQRFWKTRDTWLMFVFLGVSLYCVWLLREMRRVSLPSSVFAVGQTLPSLAADDLDGRKVSINWGADKRPSVVYIFREGCSWCGKNMANIKALTAAANSDYRIIGVSLSDDQLRTYTQQNGLAFPIYKNVQENGRPLDADGTPETLVVSRSGKIAERWLGAYAENNLKQIEQTFHVHLPGLAL